MVEKDDLPERISARVSTKVRQRIEELAAADDRPVAAVVRRLVVRALNESDDGGGIAA
jgi:predicted DNA-binding protein